MLRSSSICASFIYNYLKKESNHSDSLDTKCDKIKSLSHTFQNHGGVLSKLSQILSLDDQNCNVFSNCKPFSEQKTIKYFTTFITNLKIQLDSVDYTIYKSGSIGQVHLASYQNKEIIFKVQYVGLLKQTKQDLNILTNITSFLYYLDDMKQALIDIKHKMYEELDYNIEAYNQTHMYNLYKDNTSIQIPKLIPELSTDKIIAMYFINGQSLPDFIQNSNQQQKNTLGISLVKFIFENIYIHGVLYSDIHYGNFLVKDDSTLCVLDFGCLHYINDTLLNHIRNLHTYIRLENKTAFYKTLEDIGIIKNNISDKSKTYIYDYFCIQYQPWTSEEFEFTQDWLDMALEKDQELMKEWILPQNMTYFNKIPHAAYHIFTKLNLKGNFRQIFDHIFDNL
jgi:predicted unusual protein kinase regulating ubiquinone biosynthesis (AarF/ABC1/UbiB family)